MVMRYGMSYDYSEKGVGMRSRLFSKGFQSEYGYFLIGCKYALQLLNDRSPIRVMVTL
jgi:hypothetical protein